MKVAKRAFNALSEVLNAPLTMKELIGEFDLYREAKYPVLRPKSLFLADSQSLKSFWK